MGFAIKVTHLCSQSYAVTELPGDLHGAAIQAGAPGSRYKDGRWMLRQFGIFMHSYSLPDRVLVRGVLSRAAAATAAPSPSPAASSAAAGSASSSKLLPHGIGTHFDNGSYTALQSSSAGPILWGGCHYAHGLRGTISHCKRRHSRSSYWSLSQCWRQRRHWYSAAKSVIAHPKIRIGKVRSFMK